MLDLDNNQLSTVPRDTFSGLTSLQKLWLDNNQLFEAPRGVHSCCNIVFHPQRILLEQEYKKIYEEGCACSISYEPIEDGCEYRMCSNPIKRHYVLQEHWESWEKTCRNSKCVVCKEYDVVNNIFINKIE
jgi:hypothetical protein